MRPITLLDIVHKAVIKIITNRLMTIFMQHSILKGYNFAALPHSSTFEPFRIIDNILYDVKQHNKEIWILFQDMSKAYNRINIFMMHHALNRLKLPNSFINFITTVRPLYNHQVGYTSK